MYTTRLIKNMPSTYNFLKKLEFMAQLYDIYTIFCSYPQNLLKYTCNKYVDRFHVRSHA